MCVDEVLYERLGVRGRGVKVSRLHPTREQSDTSTPAAPLVTATTFRKSARLAEKARKEAESPSQTRGTSSARSESPLTLRLDWSLSRV